MSIPRIRLDIGSSGWAVSRLHAGWLLLPLVLVATRQWGLWGAGVAAAYVLVWTVEVGTHAARLRTSTWLAGELWGSRLAGGRPGWRVAYPPRLGYRLLWLFGTGWAVLWLLLLWTRAGPAWGAGYAVAVLGLAGLELRAWLLARSSGAWLAGTTLETRGVRAVTRCDLARTGQVAVGPGPGGLPVLRCAGEPGGHRVRVRLWRVHDGRPEPLPAEQLRALAGAVAAGGDRSRRDAAREVAEEIRSLSARDLAAGR